jgi:hypothetical protein
MSYSRYKMDFGMKVPKATRHYNRKKASQKYQIQNSVNVYNNSQNRSSIIPILDHEVQVTIAIQLL